MAQYRGLFWLFCLFPLFPFSRQTNPFACISLFACQDSAISVASSPFSSRFFLALPRRKATVPLDVGASPREANMNREEVSTARQVPTM